MPDTLQWLGQGGFLFGLNGKLVCVDPYLTDSLHTLHGSYHRLVPPPFPPRDLKADLVICTHDHIDHLDEETIGGIMHPATLFAGPGSCIAHFKRMGLPDERLRQLDRGESIMLGAVTVSAVFAEHTADSIGVVLPSDAGNIYITGDSLYSDRLVQDAERYRPRVLITCINGLLGNMPAADAALLARKLSPDTVIPCHFGLFAENTVDPVPFADTLASSGIRCHIPAAGSTVRVLQL